MKACILLCILLHLSSTFQASHFNLMTSVQSRVIACTFAKFVQNLCNFSFLLGYQLASSGKCSSANTVYRVDSKTLDTLLTQLTHNMMRDCSLNSPKNTSLKHVVYKYCFECQNKNKTTISVRNMFLYFSGELNEQSVVILWVNCCKNEGF